MSPGGFRWRRDCLPDSAWRAPTGLSPEARSAEQDQAAGDHDRRLVALAQGGSAVGSIALRLPPRSRRVRAYLRWSDGGKTYERYVGEVTEGDRAGNLSQAWRIALERGLVDQRSTSHPQR